jgi:hypothetical protein
MRRRADKPRPAKERDATEMNNEAMLPRFFFW